MFFRFNANGYDLNKHVPDYWTENNAPMQPATRAVMDLFVLSANLYGGAVVANYPYNSFVM